MKLFLIAALLIASACAEPESDAKPWLTYANYGNYGNYGYGGYPYYSGYTGYAGYGSAYPYASTYGRQFWKREAESEPESEPESKPDAWYNLYGHNLGYGAVASYPYGNGYAIPYAHASYAAPVTTVGRYVAPYSYNYGTYGLGYHHALGKREAESEPEAKPESWYSLYGHNNLGYGVASYPYGNGYALPHARTYAPYTHTYARTYAPYAHTYGLNTYAWGK